MDYRKEVCNTLAEYKYLKIYVDEIKRIMETELKVKPQSAIDYTRDNIQSNSTSSAVEDEAVILADKGTRLSEELRKNEAVIEKVDTCMATLPRKQRDVIFGKYMRCLSWREISEDIGYSVSHCKRLHNGAVYKISIAMFGLNVKK